MIEMITDRDRPTVDLTRRHFYAHAGRATCGVALGLLLASCGGGSDSSPTAPSRGATLPTVTGTPGTGGTTLTIDGNSPLSPIGGAAMVQTSSGTLLVAHAGATSFVAVTATCTHQGCTINGVTNDTYVCPCHGSTFDFNGRVLVGPATAPLRQFATQFADGILTIAA